MQSFAPLRLKGLCVNRFLSFFSNIGPVCSFCNLSYSLCLCRNVTVRIVQERTAASVTVLAEEHEEERCNWQQYCKMLSCLKVGCNWQQYCKMLSCLKVDKRIVLYQDLSVNTIQGSKHHLLWERSRNIRIRTHTYIHAYTLCGQRKHPNAFISFVRSHAVAEATGLLGWGAVSLGERLQNRLTFIPLTWRIWWAPNNASKWHMGFNPLNAELNPICYLLVLLGAHHFLHVSRIRVKSLPLRLLMSYICIYGAPILDVSRSHTTTHHSR